MRREELERRPVRLFHLLLTALQSIHFVPICSLSLGRETTCLADSYHVRGRGGANNGSEHYCVPASVSGTPLPMQRPPSDCIPGLTSRGTRRPVPTADSFRLGKL